MHVIAGVFNCASPNYVNDVKPPLPLESPKSTVAETLSEQRKLFRPYCLDDPPPADLKRPLAAYIAAAPSSWWVPPAGSYSPLDLSSKVSSSSSPSLDIKASIS
jgi:hypothetical protein